MPLEVLDLSAHPPRDNHSVTWQQGVAEYLPDRYRGWGRQHAQHLPLALSVLFMAVMTLGLSPPTAFIDEGLYLNAGHDYLAMWFADGAAIDYAISFSGVPYVYPVIAAVLDMIGGLWLVRAFSFAMVAVTVVLIARTTVSLFGYRAGMFAGAVVAFTAPVVFLSQHATHDALGLTLVVAALYLGVSKSSLTSAVWVGTLLVAAVTVKYAGVVFAPAVVGAMVLANRERSVAHGAVATALFVALMGAGYVLASDNIVEGLNTTTFNRNDGAFGVIAPTSTSNLLMLMAGHIGILAVLALAGALAVKSWRMAGVAVALAGVAMVIPAGHLQLGELSSFEKHLGYAAVFLAPLAGQGLARLSRGKFLMVPPMVLLVATLLVSEARADTMVYWGDMAPAVEVLREEPRSGTYLSTNATVLRYHTRELETEITWVETFDFWAPLPEGADAIEPTVEAGVFERVVLRLGDTGNPQQTVAKERLLDVLDASDNYKRTDAGDGWLVYTLIGERTHDSVECPIFGCAPTS